MAIQFLFVFVILLKIAYPILAFSSNIHEEMTPSEIFETFGVTSVPEYEVFSVTLPSSRRKRDTAEQIQMTVEIEGKEINLKFKRSEGHLATKYTPVWSAVTDPGAFNKIRYDPLTNALIDIGEFEMYHDVANGAAIVVYTEPDNDFVIEGIVTSKYAIKSLPKRLINEKLKLGDHFAHTIINKRSINDMDTDEATNYFAVYKVSSPFSNIKRSIPIDPMGKNRVVKRSLKRSVSGVVYPEIMIVLDYNAIRNHSMTQALRFMIAFWNGVDLIYSTLESPKVRLNLAGIIVAADDKSTRYMIDDASRTIRGDVLVAINVIGSYFYYERIRFPVENYDMIIGMTTMKLCEYQINSCHSVLGIAFMNSACTSENDIENMRKIRSIGLFRYNWNFRGIDTAAHELAHLFGVKHDLIAGTAETNLCHTERGYTMAASAMHDRQSFTWSVCSLRQFKRFFRSSDADCLHNTPLWTKPFDEVLPGRWLTIDGQCRNAGYRKACKVPKIPICMAKGCKYNDTDECVINELTTLAGSKCGENKYCNSQNACVHVNL